MRALLMILVLVAFVLVLKLALTKPPQSSEKEPPAASSAPPPSKHKKRRRKSERRPPAPPVALTLPASDTNTAEYQRPKDSYFAHGDQIEGCPNRSNAYHKCTPYCFQRWAQRSPDYTSQDRLDNFSLANKPAHWK